MSRPWDELQVLQKERQACANDLTHIKESCAKNHDRKHVVQCTECWPRLINRMRNRYLDSSSTEWFSGRQPFLQQLDTLFTNALEHRLDLKALEDTIDAEKKQWYRDKIKGFNIGSILKEQRLAELDKRVLDRDYPTYQLVDELKAVLGKSRNGEAFFDDFMGRLAQAETPQDRKHILIDTFFQTDGGVRDLAQYQAYIDRVREDESPDVIMAQLLRDRRESKSNKEQKEQLQKKLEEVKRARMGHEMEKARKAKLRQDKAKAAASAQLQYNLPRCASCDKSVQPQDFFACPLCHLLAEQFDLRDESTVYCSTECQEQSLETHVRDKHSCSSGQNCVSLSDEDVDMEGDETAIFCRECVTSLGTPSLFCKPTCYENSFRAHREDIHIHIRDRMRKEVNDQTLLEFDLDDKSIYRARNINEHICTIEEAIAEYVQRTGATMK